MKSLPFEISFNCFSVAGKSFSWLSHSRPDLCYSINRVAQVTEEFFGKKHILGFNQAVDRLSKTSVFLLKHVPLDFEFIHLKAYVGSSLSLFKR